MKYADEYIRTTPEELSKHSGKWIAVVEGEIVAASEDDVKTIYQKAKEKYPDKMPFVINVLEETTIMPTVIG